MLCLVRVLVLQAHIEYDTQDGDKGVVYCMLAEGRKEGMKEGNE